MLSKTFSAVHFGIEGIPIQIEAAKYKENQRVLITGLPGETLKEGKERIRLSLMKLGFDFSPGKIVVHLSPATLKKEGSQFDLGVAVAMLGCEEVFVGTPIHKMAFLGELGLNGEIKKVRGAVGLLQSLLELPHLETLIISEQNALEARLVNNPKIRLACHLGEVVRFLRDGYSLKGTDEIKLPYQFPSSPIKLNQIHGQSLAKRALEIALAGRHHLLFSGPPGVGKSLLAQAAGGLLPPLSERELLHVNKIHGLREGTLWDRRRPIRMPHHSISASALLGGGSGSILPGEVSLADQGILFLDEFPEFRRDAIEGMREPLQSGCIHIHRMGRSVVLPANFILIAAMNPCPCGYVDDFPERCRCDKNRVDRYVRRISGPILDRFDIFVRLEPQTLPKQKAHPADQKKISQRIAHVRQLQQKRQKTNRISVLEPENVLSKPLYTLLQEEMVRRRLNMRAQQKILHLARTIADLSESDAIGEGHLREAIEVKCPATFQEWRAY